MHLGFDWDRVETGFQTEPKPSVKVRRNRRPLGRPGGFGSFVYLMALAGAGFTILGWLAMLIIWMLSQW